MSDDDTTRLLGSKSLTDEVEHLRTELLDWCQKQLDQGARPIPLQAALTVVAGMVANAPSYGLTVNRAKIAANNRAEAAERRREQFAVVDKPEDQP